MTGLALLVDESYSSSATYDEVAYLRVAARWWRTGDQTEITRMGSPLTFWKLQQVPVLWLLDQAGHRDWVDDPIGHQQELLPLVRLGSLWIWLVAIGLTAAWSRWSYGPRAMALAAWLFVLSPNLLAHGALATMELPLVAGTTAMFWFFWRFLESNHRPWFWAAAVVGGLAFSCKYTTILVPPILAAVWWVLSFRSRQGVAERRFRCLTREVALGMLGFLLVMLLANFVVTGFAADSAQHLSGASSHHREVVGYHGDRLARRAYETPLPQDWVGFATQMHHQASGGASYLWGERRMNGWWYYYPVALASRCPSSSGSWWPPGWRSSAEAIRSARRDRMTELLPLVFLLYLAITVAGSSRNYGVRYLLPLAPLAIVWVSALAESRAILARAAVAAGLAGYAAAVVGIHPHELTYFNVLAGGPSGGGTSCRTRISTGARV